MEAFFGVWEEVNCENSDEYFKALDLPPTMRKFGINVSVVIIISQEEDDNIVVKTKIYGRTNKSLTLSFKLGEEFEEHTIDLRLCKSVVNLEDGKLVHLKKWDDKESLTISEIQDGKMIATFKFGDVVSVRTYEKI